MEALDASIAPMLERDGGDFSQRWGYLSRAGMNDKSQVRMGGLLGQLGQSGMPLHGAWGEV